jgi:GAF domain-containing protein
MTDNDRIDVGVLKLLFDAITGSNQLETMANRLTQLVVGTLGIKGAAIFMVNPEFDALELLASSGLSINYINKGPVLADKSMPDAITDMRPAIVENVADDSQLQYPEACESEGIGAILSLPIVHRDKLIGILRLYNATPREFSYKEVECLTALAELGGIAIENARYMQKLKKDHAKEMEDLWDWFKDVSGTSMLDG